MKYSLGISNFPEEISSLSHSVVFLYFLALIAEEGFFKSLLALLWNSAFRCLYLSLSPLLFASLLFTAICKASPGSHFVFLHFFSLFSESLIQFSVEGQGCVSSLLSDLRANYGGCNEDKGDLLPKSYACTATLRAPTLQQATADPRLHCRLLDTPGQDWEQTLAQITNSLLPNSDLN